MNQSLTDSELEQIFRAWWKENYPTIPVGEYTLQSHLGFGRHIANLTGSRQQKEQST